ncbi:MAG TPA: hypothetical protein VFP36_10465, partial [Usitatibacter sp.]|nr:hypothetical protein [Usitatibacter sp.]
MGPAIRIVIRALSASLLSVVFLAGSAHAHHLLDWTLVDLGVLRPGGQSFAIAVNNRGDVAGYAQSASGGMHGVLWQNGTLRDIGVPPGTAEVFVNDINDEGRIVGLSFESQAVTWKDGVWTSLGFLGEAKAIARTGEIAGTTVAGAHERAVLLREGVLTDLGTLGGLDSRVNAMNDRIHVVGRASLADGSSHAFVWAAGDMRDLGTLEHRHSVATAINNRDVIVGFAFDEGAAAAPATPFLWYGRMFRLLPGLTNVFPAAINDRNDIVGSLAAEHGAFLVADGELVRLHRLSAVQDAHFTDLTPRAINERRW